MQTAQDLLELQQVDLAILRDRKAIEAIPEAAQIQSVRAKQKDLAHRTTKITGLLKDQQIEAEDNEGRRATLTHRVEEINAANAQLTDFRKVKNNNAELDRLAKRLEKIDFNQKGVQSEIDRLEGLLQQAQQIKDNLDDQETALLKTLRERATDLRDDLEALTARRETLHEQLPSDLLKRYEKSCKDYGQLGVAELKGMVCSGCGVEMQQSQLDALRHGPDIATCPVCGRILVVRT